VKTVVSMNAQGRLTVPAAAREALKVEGATRFELEVTENAIVLRPSVAIPREDAWAYTPEHLARVERARQEGREGRSRRASENDLERAANG